LTAWTPQTPTPLAYFASLVQDDEHIPLLEAAACVAQDEYPELDVQQVLGDLDQLLARLKRRLAADAGTMQRLRMLNQFFFGDMGFGGNVNDYYNPDNSYLNAVLDSRRGIPITLALLYIEMAGHAGLKARGISFPGHFLVKLRLPRGEVVIDPFTGQSLSRDDLEERLGPYRRQRGLVGDFEVPLGLFLQEASPREFLARLLRNLKEIHLAAEDWPALLQVQERLVRLMPQAWVEHRDRGLACAELGMDEAALTDLQTYLQHCAEAEDAPALRERMARIGRPDTGRWRS